MRLCGLPADNLLEEISPCEPGVFRCEKLPGIGRLQAPAVTAPCWIAQWDKACENAQSEEFIQLRVTCIQTFATSHRY